MTTHTTREGARLNGTARAALEGVCGEVRDAGPTDQVDGVAPALVVAPGSTAEVAEAMTAAHAHGLYVVPRGRGTKLTWGRPPAAVDVVLDLSRLDEVLDHAAGDLILHVQAGARLATVQQAVSSARQRLGVDETVPGASIGGTLAANTSGPRRLSGGTVRDLLIGVTVVRADGVRAKAGGRVVKNVAGYDLGKLMTGSFGTLAVVTEAVFRLHPVPLAQRWVTVPVDDPAAAHTVVQAVVHGQGVPSAVEVDRPAGGPGTVSVLLEGREDGVAGRTATLLRALGEHATESAEAPPGWAEYPWDVTATGSARSTALKLTFVLSGLPHVLAAVEDQDVSVSLRGSAGAGVVYAALDPGTPAERVAGTVERLRAVCREHGGSLVVLDAADEVKNTVDLWGPVSGLGLMRRVKDQFDPGRRLAPGRFLGGI